VLRRLFFGGALIVSFVLGSLSGLTLALPGRSLAEAVEEGCGPLLGRPQTRFASSLRDEAFRSLPLGATEAGVLAAVGSPLGRRSCSRATTCWDYSSPMNSDANYLRRTLVFDRSGRLVDRYMGFVLGD
jgi:hypothetical protein